jgi:hypothetical protein
MGKKVEESAAGILKDELSTLEVWIREQQKKLEEDIKKINQAYEANKSSLSESGAFTDEEIKIQLSNVQKKA